MEESKRTMMEEAVIFMEKGREEEVKRGKHK